MWAEARNSRGRRDGDPWRTPGARTAAPCTQQLASNDSVVDVYCTELLHRCKSARQSRESRAESFAQNLAKPAPRRHHAERLQDNSTEGMHCIRKFGRSSLLIVARATGCTASGIGLRRKCIPCRIDAGKSTQPQPYYNADRC